MTREEAIQIIKNLPIYRMESEFDRESDLMKALKMAIESLEMKKTTKFDRMIEAFECDFSLIENGDKTFAELDRMVEDSRYSLSEHMCLMQELSYLIRHGKSEIYVKEGET